MGRKQKGMVKMLIRIKWCKDWRSNGNVIEGK